MSMVCGPDDWRSRIARLAGAIDTVKSGVAGDVGGGVVATGAICVVVPPPHAIANDATSVIAGRKKGGRSPFSR
jgi:hypothetical protein